MYHKDKASALCSKISLRRAIEICCKGFNYNFHGGIPHNLGFIMIIFLNVNADICKVIIVFAYRVSYLV